MASSSSAVSSIATDLQTLQQTQVSTVEAAKQWANDYQRLCSRFQSQWIELAVTSNESLPAGADLQQLCSSWWVFSSLSPTSAVEDGSATISPLSFLRAGQPLMVLDVPANADEAQKTALQSAARETCAVWGSTLDECMKKTEARLACSASLLPPLKPVSEMCELEMVVAETALLLPTVLSSSLPSTMCHDAEEPQTRQEVLNDMCKSLRASCTRIVTSHVQRVFREMIGAAFHPVNWQSARLLESAMTRVAGVHPCVWMLFTLCRVSVCRVMARNSVDRHVSTAAAMFVLDYCHAFMTLLAECVASPADAWHEDAAKRQAFLVDAYVAILLCRLLRGVYAPVESRAKKEYRLDDIMQAVVVHVEQMDAECAPDTVDVPVSRAARLSETEVWKTVLWPVSPLTPAQIADASSRAPWGDSFAAASAISSLLREVGATK